MNIRNGILIGLTAFMASTSSALEVETLGLAPTATEIKEGYYEIDYDSVVVEVPGDTSFEVKNMTSPKIGVIVNIGKIVWEIVKEGKPSSVWKSSHAHAVPQNAEGWEDFAGWKVPKKHPLSLKLKNKMGMTVVDFQYNVVFSYGGSFQGKGQYLRNVTVHPQHVKVLWGFHFDATVTTADPVNMGSPESPEAGMQISTVWKVQNPVNDLSGHVPVFVQGNGQIDVL